MEMKEIESAIEAILFASGEPIHVDRICLALDVDRQTVEKLLQKLMDHYAYERRGIRLLRIEDSWQLCSAPDYGDAVRKAFEIRKSAKLRRGNSRVFKFGIRRDKFLDKRSAVNVFLIIFKFVFAGGKSGAHQKELCRIVAVFSGDAAEFSENAVAKARKAEHLDVSGFLRSQKFVKKLFAFERKLFRND